MAFIRTTRVALASIWAAKSAIRLGFVGDGLSHGRHQAGIADDGQIAAGPKEPERAGSRTDIVEGASGQVVGDDHAREAEFSAQQSP